MPEPTTGRPAGVRLIQLDLVGTVAFAITAVAAAALLRPWVQGPAVAVSGALFVGGSLAFAWGFLVAVQRSRTEAIELSSLFFLKESAPAAVRRALLGLITAQVVVAIATASVRPFTTLAFGVIAPVWGLGLITLWSGRHGMFPAKTAATKPRSEAVQPAGPDVTGGIAAGREASDSGERSVPGRAANAATGDDRPE